MGRPYKRTGGLEWQVPKSDSVPKSLNVTWVNVNCRSVQVDGVGWSGCSLECYASMRYVAVNGMLAA